MKYKITATYKDETFEFYIYDHARWLTLFYKTTGVTFTKNSVFLKFVLQFYLSYYPIVIGHEAVHVYQARKLGWKYLPTYILQAIKAKFIKRNIPMEIEAYNNEHLVVWKLHA